ncbi:hypothetical protein [Amorphus sp. MBR-141]
MSRDSDTPSSSMPEQATTFASRKPWQTPTVEDADVSALTSGGGTSGIEGTSFLKTGS